ncbi:MAG: hypothetical protein WC829_14310 [Hyphomicrobium sp.]|jgi:hypothetical protein
MNHKQRRVAAYKARGMDAKAECAAVSSNNRSKRARGKMRQAVKWAWCGPNNNRFLAVRKILTYGNTR